MVNPFASITRILIKVYKWTLSPLIGPRCRHLPTCSDYADEAIAKHGLIRGGWLALKRVVRCHPWGSHGFDPVPEPGADLASAERSEKSRSV